jgi:hypothetical protein
MRRRDFVTGLALATAAGRSPAAEGAERGSDTRRIRIAQSSAICFAPIFVAGIGSWGGQCLIMGDYVRGPGATRGATAAGGRSC